MLVLSSSVRSVHSLAKKCEAKGNIDKPRISSSISRSNVALSSSSVRSGSTVVSRSRKMGSLTSSSEAEPALDSMSAVCISLLYVTRSCA
jgi:hypothetical protein